MLVSFYGTSVLCFYTSPPPPNEVGGGGEYIGISVHVSLCLNLCLDDISWTAQPFETQLGMVVYYEKECYQKNGIAILKV